MGPWPKVIVNLKNNQLEASLTGFVTKVSENKPTPNLLSTNLKENSKFIKKSVDQSKINGYYMQGLYKTFMKKGNDYFSNLCRVHFNQSLQFLNVKKGLNLHGYVPNGKVAFIPGGNWLFKCNNSKDPKGKKTLIFDLDETLIHCNENQNSQSDVRVPVTFPNGVQIMAGINIRPFAKGILEELDKYYEVIVFTASHSCYANPVIDYLDPERKFVKARLFR